MAEKKVISDFEAQIRQLIADHRRLTDLCKETAAERAVLRKENRDLQMQVKSSARSSPAYSSARDSQEMHPTKAKRSHASTV